MNVCPGVVKELLSKGEGETPTFLHNTKATFHFRTLAKQKGSDSEIVIDDSRTMGCGPFELLVGRKFKLSVWEDLVKTMRLGEKSKFTCSKELVSDYPLVSKSLRYVAKEKQGTAREEDRPVVRHRCMATGLNEHHHHDDHRHSETGYADLDDLDAHPRDLTFEIELLSTEAEGNYEKAIWSMTPDEKRDEIPRLKAKGTAQYKAENYKEAARFYGIAIGCIDELLSREHPKSDVASALETQKIPLLLNYCQCQLNLEEYADAIRHATSVLERESDNVKALFRRGKAYAASWMPQLARRDLKRAAQLDGGLVRVVARMMRELDDVQRQRDAEDRARLRGKGIFRSD